MYCVKCGVKLKDGIDKCPLCFTPVWNEIEIKKPESSFSDVFPDFYEAKKHLAFLLTILSLTLTLTILIVWFNVGKGLWGDITLFSLALIYVSLILPLWFKKYLPYIWIPVIHLSCGGYLLFLNAITGGSWFLSLAFPILGINCLIMTLFSTLMYFKFTNCFVLGAGTISYGAFSILIEFLLSITFGFDMFQWSIFSASGCLFIGILFLLSGIIKPFRNFMKKNLFF